MSEGLRLIRSILDRGSSSTFRVVDDSLFLEGEELDAYNFVRRHYRSYSELPQVGTVEEELGIEIPDAPETVDFYLQQINDRQMFNDIRPVFSDLREALMGNDMPAARDLISELQSVSRTHNTQNDLFSLQAVAEDVQSHFQDNLARAGMTGAPTGWGFIDEQTGGWQDGDFVVWVARPQVGKTHLLIHSCRAAWLEGKSVLFATMEMTMRQIGYRFFGHEAGVNPDLFRKARLSTYARRRVEDCLSSISGDSRFHLFAGDFKNRTADDLDIVIQELNPDVVYIDGMYLMQSPNAPARVNRYERVAYISDDIKGLALRRGRPVVATSQFGRGAGKGGQQGSLENVGYSDAIGTHSSIVISIKTPPGDRSVHPTSRVLEFLKGREGEGGQFAINFKLSPVDFSELVPPERQRDANEDVDMDWMP